jgi:hypothetical protein
MLPQVLLLSLVAFAAPRAALPGVAASSPRPRECVSQASEPELWARVRESDRRFCRTLARGYTRLERAPAEALSLAEAAAAERRGSPSADLLRARALLRLGRPSEAWALVARLVEARPGKPAWSIDDPGALHDVAGAAVVSGAVARGHELYRLLVARASLLPGARERTRALLEAGAAALARGPEFSSEAEVYLDEARRSSPGFDAVVLAFSALALDRAGHADLARARSLEVSDPWALERLLDDSARAAISRSSLPTEASEPVPPPSAAAQKDDPKPLPLFLPSAELHAAIAVIVAPRDPKLAEIHLRAYLADPRAGKGPWAEHTRKKLMSRADARPRREE